VHRFTPLLAEAARPHAAGSVIAGRSTNLRQGRRPVALRARAVDQDGQLIDVYVSVKRDTKAARAFFHRALAAAGAAPAEIVTDRAPVNPRLIEEPTTVS
jgi:transposase, IS6 family